MPLTLDFHKCWLERNMGQKKNVWKNERIKLPLICLSSLSFSLFYSSPLCRKTQNLTPSAAAVAEEGGCRGRHRQQGGMGSFRCADRQLRHGAGAGSGLWAWLGPAVLFIDRQVAIFPFSFLFLWLDINIFGRHQYVDWNGRSNGWFGCFGCRRRRRQDNFQVILMKLFPRFEIWEKKTNLSNYMKVYSGVESQLVQNLL